MCSLEDDFSNARLLRILAGIEFVDVHADDIP